MRSDFTLWHEGAKWCFEVSSDAGISRGWRPTRRWAKRAARRRAHRVLR